MRKKITKLSVILYTLFVITVSVLATVLYYHVFIFESFSKGNDNQKLFFEMSMEKVAASPIKDDNSIIEVLSYGCYYCALNNDEIVKFSKSLPEDATFKAIHIASKYSSLSAYAPIFATLEEMNVEESLRSEIFDTIINEKSNLKNKDELIIWLKNHDIDTEEYLKTSASENVLEKLNYMESIVEHYEITGTPAFIINKRYVVYQDRDFPEFTKYMLELLKNTQQEQQ